MAQSKSTAVIKPNLGLYLDRPSISVPPGALQDGLNFRIKQGTLNNLNLGWTPYNAIQLNGPVKLIAEFPTSEGNTFLIFGTETDLYQVNPSGSPLLSYLNPIYAQGTASINSGSTSLVGSGTLWNTVPAGSLWANVKAGDQLSFMGDFVAGNTWYTVQSVNSNTSITLQSYSGGTVSNISYVIRRLFTAGSNTHWEYDFFVDAETQNADNYGNGEDLIYLTNGVDNVVNWNGVSAQVNMLTGLGFSCKSLVNFASMMVYLNITEGSTVLGTTLINSAPGQPSNAGQASLGIAGQFIVQGETDPILNGKRLGTYLIVYCTNNIVIVSATGTATVFAFRVAAAGKGPIGQDAIAVYPTIHQFISQDGMYYFDGSNAQPINTQVWRQVMSSFDNARPDGIFAYNDNANAEMIWAVPQTTDPGAGSIAAPVTQAWTEHYLEETAGQAQSALISSAMGLNRPYSTRSFPFTAVGTFLNESVLIWNQLTNQWNTYTYRWNDAFFSNEFPIVLAGDNNGFVYQLNTGQLGNGTPLNCFVKFGRRAVVDGKMRGMVRRIYPFVSFLTKPLTVTAAFADFAMGPETIVASFTYDQSFSVQGAYMVPVYRRGRYVDVSFGDATGNPWIISGYDLDVLPGGMR